jgi:hypothetical protein
MIALLVFFLWFYLIQFLIILSMVGIYIETKRDLWLNLIPFYWFGYLIKLIINEYNKLK